MTTISRVATSFSIRRASPNDISLLVQIHLQSFPSFFLTFLGYSFLAELYASILIDPSGIALVAEGDKNIVGFVAGTSQPAGFYSRLLRRRWWRFAVASVSPILRKPTAIPRLLRAFSMPKQVTKLEGRGTLMSIAILPEVQGEGIGKALVAAFLNESVHHGLSYVDLETDRDENEATNQFYLRLGFTRERTYVTFEGRGMNQYVIRVVPEQ